MVSASAEKPGGGGGLELVLALAERDAPHDVALAPLLHSLPPASAGSFVMPETITLKETIFNCAPLCVIGMQAPDSQLNAPDATRMAGEILRRTLRDKSYAVVYRQPVFKRGDIETRIGRYYPRNVDFACYQSMMGSMRRLSVAGKYSEVDMVSAHPTILFSVARDPVFATYISRRDEMLQAVMTRCGVKRWAAKNLFIRLGYGGEVSTWQRENCVAEDPPGAAEYEAAVKRFVTGPFKTNPEYAIYHTYARAQKKGRLAFSALAYYLQTLEARAITCAIERLKARNVEVCSLIHDGVLVDTADAEGLDRDALAAEVSHLSGVPCRFDVKPLETDEEDEAFYRTALKHTTYRTLDGLAAGGLAAGGLSPGALAADPLALGATPEPPTSEALLSKAVRAAASATHADVAALFKHMFPGDHVYLGKTAGWYEFTAPRWVPRDTEPMEIPRRLNNEVLQAVQAEAARVKDAFMVARGDPLAPASDAKALHAIAKGLDDISLKLRDSRFKLSVIRELAVLYCNKTPKRWMEGLDCSNKHLLALDDAVIDLAAASPDDVVRDGLPEDMLSMSLGFSRAEFLAPTDEDRLATILGGIRATQDNDATYEYILDVLAYSLHGERPHDFFSVWSGTGANGKGLIKEVVEAAFGELGYYPDPQMFMKRSVRGGVLVPELTKMHGKRIVVCSEAEGCDEMRSGLIRQLTGGDKIQGRECYRGAVEFKACANLVFLFNEVPSIEDSSGGIARRMRLTDFKIKFVEHPSAPLEKQIDTALRPLFGQRASGLEFLRFLVRRFHDRRRGDDGGLLVKLPTPPEVLLAASGFLAQCDQLQQFIDEHYVRTTEYRDKVLYADFKNLLRERMPGFRTKGLMEKLRMKGLPTPEMKGSTRIRFLKPKDGGASTSSADDDDDE